VDGEVGCGFCTYCGCVFCVVDVYVDFGKRLFIKQFG